MSEELPVVVGGARDARFAEIADFQIEKTPPYGFEPVFIPKPGYEARADSIVCLDENPAKSCFCKGLVSITTKCPLLGTIVGPIDAGSDVTSLTAGSVSRG